MYTRTPHPTALGSPIRSWGFTATRGCSRGFTDRSAIEIEGEHLDTPLPAYSGAEPYVFVCYAHEDSSVVYPDIRWLQEHGVNVWYDKGISAGAHWRAVIGDKLLGSSRVLFYISEGSLQSDHCSREINLALDEAKVIVPVYLRRVELTPDLKVGLNRVQSLSHAEGPNYRARLLRALGPADASGASLSGDVRTALPTRQSILVMPFANVSPDDRDAYFADGLTEEVIASLSQVRGLRVISIVSAMALKGTQKDLKTIGRELETHYVLHGSVRKWGDDLRITAQLLDATTDDHLWVERFSGTLSDVFDIQERTARAIVAALKLELTPDEDREIAARPLDDARAYDCYLKARSSINTFTRSGFDHALEQLQLAQDLVGDNAVIYAGIAYAHYNCANLDVGEGRHADDAEAYARKALELDPECAEAHLALGLVYQAFRGDQRRAFEHLERCLSIKPNDPGALFWLVVAQYAVGRLERAPPLLNRLERVDPLDPNSRWLPVFALHGMGRYEDAAAFAWHQLPHTSLFDFFHAVTLAYAGHVQAARECLAESLDRRYNEPVFVEFMRLLACALDGDGTAMVNLLGGRVVRSLRRDPIWSYYVAAFCALGGQRDAAVDWIAKAVDRGFINFPLLNGLDPFLAKLRDMPAFEGARARAQREWESFLE